MVTNNHLHGQVLGPVVQSGSITGGLHFHLDGGGRPAPRELPPAPTEFTGRARELDLIDQATAADDRLPGVARQVLITGQGGVGKTALCLHWAYRTQADYPDGQLYADLAAGKDRVLSQFLTSLGVHPERTPTQLDDQAALFHTLTADRRILVLVENVTAENWDPSFVPASAAAVVLLTSRWRPLPVIACGAALVEVSPLSSEDAVTLLARCVGGRVAAEPAAAGELAGLCGGLPLALRVIGARLTSRPKWSIDTVARSLRDERERLNVLSQAPTLSVRAVFDLSYAALPSAVRYLYRALGTHPGPDFGVDLAAAAAGVRRSEGQAAVDTLVDASLLEDLGGERYRFHDLVKLHARELAIDIPVRRLLDWYLYVARHVGTIITPHRTDTRCDVEYLPPESPAFADDAEALNWLITERGNLLACARYALDNDLPTIAWQLAESMWGLFLRHAHYVDWLSFDRIGLDAARLSGDRTAEAEAEDRIGLAFNALERDEDAIQHILRAQRLWIEIGNPSRIAGSYRRLAFVYKRQGDYDRAAEHFTRALTAQRELGLTREVGLTLRSIGNTHVAAGRPQAALAYLHESATLLESLPKVDPYNCARTRTTLGLALAHLGRYDEALANLTVALRNMRSAGSVSGESEVLSLFGEVHERRGNLADARHHYEQALALIDNMDNPARDRLRAKLRAWPDTPDDEVRPAR